MTLVNFDIGELKLGSHTFIDTEPAIDGWLRIPRSISGMTAFPTRRDCAETSGEDSFQVESGITGWTSVWQPLAGLAR